MIRSLCDADIREMTCTGRKNNPLIIERRKLQRDRRKVHTMVDPSVERRKKDRRRFS